jgi:hypothetical protein
MWQNKSFEVWQMFSEKMRIFRQKFPFLFLFFAFWQNFATPKKNSGPKQWFLFRLNLAS